MAVFIERPIAVYRVHPATFWITIFLAFLLETFLPSVMPLARLFDFPLLVVIYFALLRRNKVFGTLLGASLGVIEDALSHGFLGIMGIVDSLIGYVAAWASVRFDLEQFFGRFAVTGLLVALRTLVLAALERALLESLPAPRPLDLVSVVLVNLALALILFQLLDRFRLPA